MNDFIRSYINFYDDPLKVFIEVSLNRMDFFKNLPKYIKNEWIFNMEPHQIEPNSYLYKQDTNSEEMYLI